MPAAEFDTASGLRYGALGFPLAFVALPLYVSLPAHYANQYGVPLATLGGVLLGARLLDAVTDPLIGRLSDRLLRGPALHAIAWMTVAALLLASGFAGLFFPPVQDRGALVAWCAALLVITCLGYSILSVMHQAWGARLGGSGVQQTRVVAWREGFGLGGVIVASLLPTLLGMAATALALAVGLGVGLALLTAAPRGMTGDLSASSARTEVWRTAGFRRLIAVFLLNGIAGAIPATLLMFFVQDRLQTPDAAGLYLAAYFIAAALSLPLWLRIVSKLGQPRAWGLAMLSAVLAFAWAAGLGVGDSLGYTLVCIASGASLGADVAIPGAMLAGVVQRAGLGAQAEGAFFGWWNAANKLNLALAAGLALPLLQMLGYAPGQRDPHALHALGLVYCALPCALKLAAAALLYVFWIRPKEAFA